MLRDLSLLNVYHFLSILIFMCDNFVRTALLPAGKGPPVKGKSVFPFFSFGVNTFSEEI